MVFLQHLYVWVVWETFFADRREVGRLPPTAIQVGLDLGRHADSGGTKTGEGLWHVKQAGDWSACRWILRLCDCDGPSRCDRGRASRMPWCCVGKFRVVEGPSAGVVGESVALEYAQVGRSSSEGRRVMFLRGVLDDGAGTGTGQEIT